MFEGKVALVTAAGQGIGRAMAMLFASEGARVAVGDIAEDRVAETVELIRAAGGEALFRRADVTEEQDIIALVGAAVSSWGRLDAVANNAGHPISFTSVLDCPNEDFEKAFALNLRSTFWGIKHGARAMLETGGGAIVNTASAAGVMATYNLAAYTAMKHGVVGLTRSAGVDLAGKGVRVNAILPGYTESPRTVISRGDGINLPTNIPVPIGRAAKPMEQAEAAVWLCSHHASFIVGTTLCVDGGVTAM
jgi:NAD(P)-dependent dehydrogenase (short-subunit alcohol dehydrogenase family)